MALHVVASRAGPGRKGLKTALLALPWSTPAGGLVGGLRRTPAARALPPRGADRARRAADAGGEGDRARDRAAGVPAAARPAPDGPPDRRAAQGVVTGRTDAEGEGLPAALVTEHLQFSLPYRSLFRHGLGCREPAGAGRRARRAPGAAAPRRLLLGRRVALERAVPACGRRFRGLPRRRRDRRAQADAVGPDARARPDGRRARTSSPSCSTCRPARSSTRTSGPTRSSTCWPSATTRCGAS